MSSTAEAVWAGSINPDDFYPDLFSVATLYPGADPRRPSLDTYERALELQGRLSSVVREALDKAAEITERTPAVIYVAGPLTGTSEEHKARYDKVSELLATYPASGDEQSMAFFGYVPHLHGTDPVKHPNVSADEVRDIDYIWGRLVPVLTVNFTYPTAHGNAIEEGWGEAGMIPATYLNPSGNKLSRLTLGMNNVVRTIEYNDFETDGLDALKITFDEMYAWMKTFPGRDLREFFYLGYDVVRTPLLVEHGLDPTVFNPVFPVDHTMVYINNPGHPYYGMVGRILWHDWKESGDIAVEFPYGDAIRIHDQSGDFTYWRTLPSKQTGSPPQEAEF